MRRILVWLISLSLLATSLAWAADSHHAGLVGHSQEIVGQAGDEGPNHPGEDRAPADHCCHAAGHLLGTLATLAHVPPSAPGWAPGVRRASFTSLTLTPPNPPPTI